MRVACLALLVAVTAIGLASCHSSSRTHADPVPGTHAPYAPRAVPKGWFVFRAYTSAVDKSPPSQALYARPRGFSAQRDPALLVGQVPEDVDLPPLSDRKPVPGFGFGSATIGHAGGYTIAYWVRDADIVTYVMARGVTDADVTRSARAAQFHTGAPVIPRAALPPGFEEVATSRLPPRLHGGGGQAVSVATGDWRHHVDLSIIELGAAAQTVESFLSGLPAAPKDERNREARVGSATVFAHGDAPQAVLDDLVHSIAPVEPREWTAFQRRVLNVPPALLFPGCQSLADTVVITAASAKVRWAVALPGGARPTGLCVGTAVVEAGSSYNGYSSAGAGPTQPWGAGPGSFGDVMLVTGNGSAGPGRSGATIGGTVPAATARVGVRAGTRNEIPARLADRGSDPAHRFFGAYLPWAPSVRLVVTAYAADGHALGRWVSF